ncbi:hypothetical protein KY285_011011 [Solanum tuberosum]|nr:hypothetical protein KY284_011098 [Solanum tuberosum]KAH0735304.1 hypothetical protein KY285_011011 [Solanum tuberosum]
MSFDVGSVVAFTLQFTSTTIGGGGSPDFEGKLSLLEELGINTKQIYQKM